ncbi:unnamed protein product [Rhizoctonia solani]|uniref:Major facilitator superfamily (MFS) profile domain-containing protein n=1 Tax=Rhizoctonia solani TaxID=456999 RepID=A0A8H3BI04_9AGAM|nr:unnamed protein product [Rhizoctonia solani]
MTSRLDTRTQPDNPDRDWDSQTIGDSSPVGNNPLGEKSIEQVEKAISSTEGQTDEFVEGGIEGWKVVIGCALISGPSIGWNLIWGVFQKYHANHFLAGTPGATLSVIGSLQNSLMMALAFVSGKFGDRYGYKKFIAAGCIVVFVGQLLAAFCDNLWSIFLTQGVLQGLGCGLLLPMIFAIPSQWFKKRRGLATGFVIAGSSFGGAVPALIVQEMLDRMSFRNTLLIYSFVQGVTMLAGFLLVKVRPSAPKPQTPAREIKWFDKKYLTDPMFWSFWVALFFALFGYMSPFVFISVYTSEKIPNISTQLANLPIPIMSFASAIGRTGAGYVADRIGFMNAFILAISISGLSQLILWNVAAETYAGIMVFSLVTPIAASMYGIDNLATLTGLFNIANVPGLLSGPPIGGVILEGAGRNWHALAAYSGGIQILGVICMLYARFKKDSRLFGRV